MVVYNGPSVDSVNDSLSFDAFIDFAGDVDSYFFAPQFSGNYIFDVGDFGNTVDPEIAIYDSTTGARIAYNDDLSDFNDDAQVSVNLTADVRYIVAVADFANATAGNVSINVSAPFRTGSFIITPDAFGDTSTAVTLDVPTDIDYYSVIAPSDTTGGLTIIATESTFNHRLAVFDATGRLVQGPSVSINISVINPNQEYRIAVYSQNYATSGSLNLQVDFAESGAIVTNSSDAGPGSLRQAILDANAHPNAPGVPDKIRFDLPSAGPHNIVLVTELPFITEAVEIDGNTQPGTGATPTIAIDGSALTGASDGLRINADGSIIRKLNIRKFPGDGIDVRAKNVLLEGNTIGTDWLGQARFGNKGNGILIQGGSDNRIDSNVVSGNDQSGIVVRGNGADRNTLSNNTVGARFNGNFALANSVDGIQIIDGDLNDIVNNTISGNTNSGVSLSGSANSNTLSRNKIGLKTSGTAALPNGGNGVSITSSGNQVGGNRVGLRNIISGNGKSGVFISGPDASSNVIEGNYIGTNLNGTTAIPNLIDGVFISAAGGNRVGSTTDAAAGNVISGNNGSGITFSQVGAAGAVAAGNTIGLTSDGLTELGNQLNGVTINGNSTNVEIGGSTAIATNTIAASGGAGVFIAQGSNNNRISRNRIGINTAGSARGNATAGVLIQGLNNTVGGVSAAFANTIAGNVSGVSLSGVNATNNVVKFNTIGTDTASNSGNGIQLVGGASSNAIGPGNTIRRNNTGIVINGSSQANRISQNAISDNVNLGIDLLPSAGFTANDVADSDVGANSLQNFPQFFGNPLLIGNSLEISFSVNSAPANSAYPLTVEFYVSDGSGEGKKFVGSTVYTAANFTTGVKTINFAGAGAGLSVGTSKLVGLATDLNGNSSEFSPQRSLASSAARLSMPAPQSRFVADINWDGIVNSTDATLLIGVISNPSGSRSAVTNDVYDTNGDSEVDANDLLFVLRTIQVKNANRQAVEAIDRVSALAVWDAGLGELMTQGLPDVRKALLASKLIKSS